MDTNIQRYGDTYRDSAIYKGSDRDKDIRREKYRDKGRNRDKYTQRNTEIQIRREKYRDNGRDRDKYTQRKYRDRDKAGEIQRWIGREIEINRQRENKSITNN